MDAIAIDGPAGSGKSTIARALAERLGFLYVDTGAMYRAVALAAQRRGVDLEDEAAVADVAGACSLAFDASGTRILLEEEDVSDAIRTPEVTGITKYAARVPAVRERMRILQQDMARQRPVVMEGRDITTVVLPEARWRFFVTASVEVRAKRRLADFTRQGHTVDLETLKEDIRERDRLDEQVGPMREAMECARHPGGGIHLVDTSDMSPEEVIGTMAEIVERDR